MNTVNREELIRNIYEARVRGVVVPTDLFGRKIFVKTTKYDIIAQIRKEYAEDQKVNLRFRVDEENDVGIIESVRSKPGTGEIPVIFLPEDEQPQLPKRSRGRPKGSKNRPKPEMEAQDEKSSEETVTEEVSEEDVNQETTNSDETSHENGEE